MSQDTRRNTLIKDTMREQCIPSLVESWFQILQTYQRSHPELTCQCLEVVGAYVSWIDLNLIANDRWVLAVFSAVGGGSRSELCLLQVREPAAGSDVHGGAAGGGLRLPVRDRQ